MTTEPIDLDGDAVVRDIDKLIARCDWLVEALAASNRRAEQAEQAVARVRELHQRDDPDSHYPRCTACPGTHWPCTTVDALAGGDAS